MSKFLSPATHRTVMNVSHKYWACRCLGMFLVQLKVIDVYQHMAFMNKVDQRGFKRFDGR